MTNYRFSKQLRLKSTKDFARVFDVRCRVGDSCLLVFGAANGQEVTRVGLSVSKKHGNAVKRVRLKRLLREAFRLSRHDLPRGLDLILIPKQNRAADLRQFQVSLIRAARKLAKRLSLEDAG